MKYIVYWVGGKKDGEEIATFETEREAIAFAEDFQREHEDEFHPTWGGVMIQDEAGNAVDW